MYKASNRFQNSLRGAAKRGRYNGGMVLSTANMTPIRSEPHWLQLVRRLDAEVAKAKAATTPQRNAVVETPSAHRRRRRKKPLDGQRIYLVRFTLRADPTETFIKVGISSMDIRARFQPDGRLYSVELIAESNRFSPRDARLMEQSIHVAFLKSRYWPSIRLRSGNTECYQHTEQNVQRFSEIVKAV